MEYNNIIKGNKFVNNEFTFGLLKDEWSVFQVELQGSITYYHSFEKRKDGKWGRGPWYNLKPYKTLRFNSVDEAMETLKAIIADINERLNCKHGKDNIVVMPNGWESDTYSDMFHRMWHNHEVFYIVCKTPAYVYIGGDWADSVANIGNTAYNDNERYQVCSHDCWYKPPTRWLRQISENEFDWVDDRLEASFFNKETAEKHKAMVKTKGVGEYKDGSVTSMPLRPDRMPKYKIGDKVVWLDYKQIPHCHSYCTSYGEVLDIIVTVDKNGNKGFEYILDDHRMTTVEYPENELHTLEELKAKGGKTYYQMHRGRRCLYIDYNDRSYLLD